MRPERKTQETVALNLLPELSSHLLPDGRLLRSHSGYRGAPALVALRCLESPGDLPRPVALPTRLMYQQHMSKDLHADNEARSGSPGRVCCRVLNPRPGREARKRDELTGDRVRMSEL